jgi:hypothetical protein
MQSEFLALYNELTPLKKAIAATVEYQKLRFTYEDIIGFLDDKLIHVWLKYEKTHEYEEIKALAISSLYHMKYRIYKKYGREFPLEIDPEFLCDEEYSELPSIEVLMGTIDKILPEPQAQLAKVIICPPVYVLAKVNDLSKRIPSKYFLDFLGYTVNKQNVKMMNTLRRDLRDILQRKVDPETLQLKTL